MFTVDTTDIKNKITKNYERAKKEFDVLGIRMDGSRTDLIGVDVYEPGALSAFFAFKSNDKSFVTGHFSSHSLVYSSFEDFPANIETKKFIAINGQNHGNIKCYFLDDEGFGLEISNNFPLAKDETLIIFVETDGECILLLAGVNFYDDSKHYVTLTSSSSTDTMRFLRNVAFEMLGLISQEPIKEIQGAFHINTQED